MGVVTRYQLWLLYDCWEMEGFYDSAEAAWSMAEELRTSDVWGADVVEVKCVGPFGEGGGGS